MTTFTYEQLREQLLLETDTQGESFITVDEMIGYFNDAIDEAEGEVLKLDLEYFLRQGTIKLEVGKADYKLPKDINVAKIRGVLFNQGSKLYKVDRIRRLNKFEQIKDIERFGLSDDYKYYLKHETVNKGIRLILVPASRDGVGSTLDIWYIREANRIPLLASGATQLEIDETIIDMPEANKFIKAFVKVKVMEKEGSPLLQQANGQEAKQRKRLVEILTPQVVDDDDTVEEDFSIYQDHS